MIDSHSTRQRDSSGVPTRLEGELDRQSYALLRGAEILKNRDLTQEATIATQEAEKIRAELYRTHPGAYPEYQSYVPDNPAPADNPEPAQIAADPVELGGYKKHQWIGFKPARAKTYKLAMVAGFDTNDLIIFYWDKNKVNRARVHYESNRIKLDKRSTGSLTKKGQAIRGAFMLRMRDPFFRHPKPKKPKVSNPTGYTDAEERAAIKIYTAFFGHEPDGINVIRLKKRSMLVRLGECVSLTYQAEKHGNPLMQYIHNLDNPADVLWDASNGCIVIRSRHLDVTKHGIEG